MSRPNVVLIMTDQQRFDSISALGHPHVDTPNLDRLVHEGAAFTRAYVASPSCAPSRASLFTGLYPHTSGVLRNDDRWAHSWVEILADAGYRCTSIGKMHTYPYEASVGFHERHVVENKDRAHPSLPFFLEALDRRGVLDDTVIVFTSDHGDALGDHGHSQKWNMYEPSVRVPAILWAPGRIDAGTVIDSLVSLMDIGPTVLELADLPVPPWMEAHSLLPAVTGREWEGRRYVFSEHARDLILTETELMTMVRDDRWKLVEFLDHERGQLFDLENDPNEEHDLWSVPEHAAERLRLHEAIATWRARSALHTATWAKDFR